MVLGMRQRLEPQRLAASTAAGQQRPQVVAGARQAHPQAAHAREGEVMLIRFITCDVCNEDQDIDRADGVIGGGDEEAKAAGWEVVDYVNSYLEHVCPKCRKPEQS